MDNITLLKKEMEVELKAKDEDNNKFVERENQLVDKLNRLKINAINLD